MLQTSESRLCCSFTVLTDINAKKCVYVKGVYARPKDFKVCFCFFGRSHYFYSYLDARFYDDEMLTVVLQGSEELNARPVLAQIPISSSLSCETEFNWEPNLRFVFTNFFDLSSFNNYKSFSDI